MTASPRPPAPPAARPLLPPFLRALRGLTATIRRSRPGDPWLIGFSHGADSTALLAGLAAWAGHESLPPLVAVHVDHGLRRGSEREAEAARAFATRLGLPCRVLRIDLPAGSGEGRARSARYRAFAAEARARGASLLCLAHHARDQDETRLLRLLRGTGPLGLAGMPARRKLCATPHGPCTLIRPLLASRPEELRSWLVDQGHRWIEDPSNADPGHGPRNAVRHGLLARLRRHPRARAALAALGREAERLEAAVEAELATLAAELATLDVQGASDAERAMEGWDDEVAPEGAWPVAILARLSPWAFERWLGQRVAGLGRPRPSRALCRQARALLAPGRPSGRQVGSRGHWRLIRGRHELRFETLASAGGASGAAAPAAGRGLAAGQG